jgi:Condensation domain
MMRRKLSHIEHIVEGNIVYFVRVEGPVTEERLRLALARVQRKHPALRLVTCEEAKGLYYEFDCAGEIPLRILRKTTDEDTWRERDRELGTEFTHGRPLLRAVWLRGESEHDLLLATSHRVCDGASMLIVVRELLRAIYSEEPEVVPYGPLTRRDIIRDYQPEGSTLGRRWRAAVINSVLRVIPEVKHATENREHFLEWRASRAFSEHWKARCKTEGVSMHAALLTAFDRSLRAVFGHKTPRWIENPVDIRRGRFPVLKDDMLFFGGGNFKVETGQSPEIEFWARSRIMHEQIRRLVEQELARIPARFFFSEMLRPLRRGQLQWIVRAGDALRMNGSWNRFAFSNLGNVVVSQPGTPIAVRDLRIYMHSLNVRMLCLVTYTLNGEMRFHCAGDEKCLSREQAARLQQEFRGVLEREIGTMPVADEEAREASLGAVAGE